MNIFAYFYLGYFIISKFLKNEFRRWLINGTLIPLIISISIGVLSYYLTLNLTKGYFIFLYSIIIGLISLVINLYVFNQMNPEYKINLKKAITNG
jgi:hypothetical protein